MTGAGVRPVVAGYVAVPAHASPEAAQGLLSAWRRSFAAYASREGYCLGSVFTDLRGREERGLYGLADYLRRDGVVGVVVPDVGHLMHVRALAGADWRTVQRFLRSAVLVVAAPVLGGVGLLDSCATGSDATGSEATGSEATGSEATGSEAGRARLREGERRDG